MFLSKDAVAVDRSICEQLKDLLINIRNETDFTLLNSPIFPEGISSALSQAKHLVQNLCNRIELLDSHTALFFLSSYVSAPRLTYLMRTTPMHLNLPGLKSIDETVRLTSSLIANVQVLVCMHIHSSDRC